MSIYTSSIVTKYGDVDNVKKDTKTLFEILDRQGASLLIDAIAEYTATEANKLRFAGSDRSMTMIALVDELEASLKERL